MQQIVDEGQYIVQNVRGLSANTFVLLAVVEGENHAGAVPLTGGGVAGLATGLVLSTCGSRKSQGSY